MRVQKYVSWYKFYYHKDNKFLVYKRYFTKWYTNENGKYTRDMLDFFDTYFETRAEAKAWCDKFNMNRYW